MKITSINKLKEGDKVFGFFICRRFNAKITRLGDPFIDLLLEDSTGSIRAKIWSFVDRFNNKEIFSKPCAVKGKVVSFNQSLEIDIYHLSVVNDNLYDKYGYNNKLLVKKNNKNVNFLYKKLISYIQKISHKSKKDILKLIENYKNEIIVIPSIDKKYSQNGGYLNQIVTVLDLNNKVFDFYKYDHLDQVNIGIILKNIGLIIYYKEKNIKANRKSKVKGFNLLSLEIINEKLAKYDDILSLMQNMIIQNNQCNNKSIDIVNYLYDLDLMMLG